MRAIAIAVNAIGFLFFMAATLVGLAMIETANKLLVVPFVFAAFGFSPLIVTTYCLWYLEKPKENFVGIFIVTPVVVLLHWWVLHVLSSDSVKLSVGLGIEFIAAISFVAIGIRLGHVRNKPQFKVDFAQPDFD